MAKQDVTECTAIDVWDLLDSVRERPDDPLHETWVGGELGTVTWAIEGRKMLLSIPRRTSVDGGRPQREVVVYLVREGMPGRGGARTWFRCPGCGVRCRKILLPPDQDCFVCRSCSGRTYGTRLSRVIALDSRIERYRQLEERLQEPGIRFRTVVRLSEQADVLLARILRAFDLSRRLERLEKNLRRMAEPQQPRRGPGRPTKLERRGRGRPPEPTLEPTIRRSRGRPKVKRAYRRSAPLRLATSADDQRAFCGRCRDRRQLTNARTITFANGRTALAGQCEDCGCSTSRIVGSPTASGSTSGSSATCAQVVAPPAT